MSDQKTTKRAPRVTIDQFIDPQEWAEINELFLWEKPVEWVTDRTQIRAYCAAVLTQAVRDLLAQKRRIYGERGIDRRNLPDSALDQREKEEMELLTDVEPLE